VNTDRLINTVPISYFCSCEDCSLTLFDKGRIDDDCEKSVLWRFMMFIESPKLEVYEVIICLICVNVIFVWSRVKSFKIYAIFKSWQCINICLTCVVCSLFTECYYDGVSVSRKLHSYYFCVFQNDAWCQIYCSCKITKDDKNVAYICVLFCGSNKSLLFLSLIMQSSNRKLNAYG
jgi:hypothetical protein